MKDKTSCRICGAKLPAQSDSPFCSERCKMNDLSKWFGENYRVASAAPVEHEFTSEQNQESE